MFKKHWVRIKLWFFRKKLLKIQAKMNQVQTLILKEEKEIAELNQLCKKVNQGIPLSSLEQVRLLELVGTRF